MSNPQKKLIRRLCGALVGLALLVPVTVSPGQGIDGNEACADSTCCRELNSVCLKDGSSTSHYYQSDGACTISRM